MYDGIIVVLPLVTLHIISAGHGEDTRNTRTHNMHALWLSQQEQLDLRMLLFRGNRTQ